jgi:hypothetical protein
VNFKFNSLLRLHHWKHSYRSFDIAHHLLTNIWFTKSIVSSFTFLHLLTFFFLDFHFLHSTTWLSTTASCSVKSSKILKSNKNHPNYSKHVKGKRVKCDRIYRLFLTRLSIQIVNFFPQKFHEIVGKGEGSL